MSRPRRPTVWQAVADPTRRRLIELLRQGPRTTGDLARSFPVTRFAVMKHLSVLEDAGVVRVRRAGRERWNELDPASLAELAARWPQPATDGVLRGVDGRETEDGRRRTGGGEEPPVPGAGLAPLGVELDVFLDAAPSLVFDALTFNVSAWWGPPFVRSAAATGVVLEGHLGGRFYEEWGHRQGAVRGTVTAIRQNERLEITGALGRGVLLPSALEFTLSPREGGTLLHFVHRALLLPDGQAASTTRAYRAAWQELLAGRLKAFVERGVRSGIGQVQADGTSPLF